MDEPLGTLDAEFRELMCLELRKLHNNIDATTVYVTHDQLEAMSMGDRIAVMNEGKILQYGKPKDIYTKPKTKFVGSFIGSPAMNFIPVNHAIQKNQNIIKIDNEEYTVPKSFQNSFSKNNVLGVRPQKMFLSDVKGIPGEVYGSEYLGTRKILTIQSQFGTYKIRVSNDVNITIGTNVIFTSLDTLILYVPNWDCMVRIFLVPKYSEPYTSPGIPFTSDKNIF
jgi:multiple sugar transport system ATP-binding protein